MQEVGIEALRGDHYHRGMTEQQTRYVQGIVAARSSECESLYPDQHPAVVKQQTRSVEGAVGGSPCACNSRQPDHMPQWRNSRHADLKHR
jgi:hypothetical protein